jgi:serine/threonine protein kinase
MVNDRDHSTGASSDANSERLAHACPECQTALDKAREKCPCCGRQARGTEWLEIAALDDPWLGRVVGERYRLQQCIGRGASGAVYRADSLSIARSFAIKVIDFSSSEIKDGATRAEHRFEREIETLGALRNPHIVSVYDLLRPDEDVVAIVMDLVAGRTVQQMVAEDGPMEPTVAADLVQQVANGLHEAHERGIIHRDIKPANIMAEELPAGDLFAHILDFGVVYRDGESSDITQGFVGTPLYTSPEQARGKNIDRRSDIYSLGATAFFMLTGRPPFEAESAFEALRAHLEQSAPRLSVACEHVIPPEFDDVMARILSKEPDRRPDTLTRVIEHLDRMQRPAIADSEPVLAMDAAPGQTQDSSPAADAVLEHERAGAEFERRDSTGAEVIRPHKIDGSGVEAAGGEAVEPADANPDATDPGESMQRVQSDAPLGDSVVDASLSRTRLAVLDVTGDVHIADETGAFEKKITINGDREATAVAIDSDTVFVGNNHGQVHRFCISSGEVDLLYESGRPSRVVSLVTCAKGERLGVGYEDGAVVYYDIVGGTGGHAHRLASGVPVSALAMCPEFGGFAVCRVDRTVTLHSTEKPDVPVAEFTTAEVVEKAAFSNDAHLLAVSERDGALEIYHADTGHQLMPPKSLKRTPMTVSFGADDRLSALCEIDGTIYRWNLHDRFLGTDADSDQVTVES